MTSCLRWRPEVLVWNSKHNIYSVYVDVWKRPEMLGRKTTKKKQLTLYCAIKRQSLWIYVCKCRTKIKLRSYGHIVPSGESEENWCTFSCFFFLCRVGVRTLAKRKKREREKERSSGGCSVEFRTMAPKKKRLQSHSYASVSDVIDDSSSKGVHGGHWIVRFWLIAMPHLHFHI